MILEGSHLEPLLYTKLLDDRAVLNTDSKLIFGEDQLTTQEIRMLDIFGKMSPDAITTLPFLITMEAEMHKCIL